MNSTSEPASFVNQMQFAKPWRAYQARVLGELEQHLEDRHFHLISAPGSGKTVIGLEVVRQIGQPALVLAPTLAIREQWIHRLISDFLDGSEKPKWLSRELANPAALTVITYQSLYTEFSKENGAEQCLKQLGRAGITTLVVDEAHHLRASWWKCLSSLKQDIPSPTIVALTATPPIDVPAAERGRYESFCGPVDVEVGVPELVAENNLCPHQDYVLFSVPEGRDRQQLETFQTATTRLATELNANQPLAKSLVKAKPPIEWIAETDDADFLKENQPFYLALAIFLRSHRYKLPQSIRDQFGINDKELPKQLSLLQSESLLNGLLYTFQDRLDPATQEIIKPIADTARSIGAIENSQVGLTTNEENEKLLRDSASKLSMIQHIVEHEAKSQANALRSVILTDYIRKDDVADVNGQFTKVGVVPIFETLRQSPVENLRIGVLTGSIVIIPSSSHATLAEFTSTKGIPTEHLSTKALASDTDYLQISVRDTDQQKLISAITELFDRGDINCLVGTAALLGEGWDAPALSTLILASVIGSFVMSNQMRGRAIRTNPNHEGKISNIWHIATIAPKFSNTNYHPGPDFDRLERRFDAFHGVGFDLEDSGYSQVQSGWARLGIEQNITPAKAEVHNKRMLRLAKQREVTEYTWKRAIAPILKGKQLRAVSELYLPKPLVTEPRGLFKNWRAKRLLNKLTKVIYISLAELDLINQPYKKRLIQIQDSADAFLITCPQLDPSDQKKFVSAVTQFFDVLEAPRYLITQGEQFYKVPNLLAGTKHSANRFSRNLEEFGFGKHELFYTHSDEGTALILHATKKQLLKSDSQRVDNRISWQPV